MRALASYVIFTRKIAHQRLNLNVGPWLMLCITTVNILRSRQIAKILETNVSNACFKLKDLHFDSNFTEILSCPQDISGHGIHLVLVDTIYLEVKMGKRSLEPRTAHAEAGHLHDDVIKWKHFPRYWLLCGEITGHQWIPLKRPVMWSFE